MAIAILHVVKRKGLQATVTQHHIRADQYVTHLAAIGTGIHTDSTANRAGDSAQKLGPGQRMVACETGRRYTGCPRAADDHFRILAMQHNCSK